MVGAGRVGGCLGESETRRSLPLTLEGVIEGKLESVSRYDPEHVGAVALVESEDALLPHDRDACLPDAVVLRLELRMHALGVRVAGRGAGRG